MKKTITHLLHIDNSGPICGARGNIKTTPSWDYNCKRCDASMNRATTGSRMGWL